jgi:exodeoxyribonuclease V alpha subunit
MKMTNCELFRDEHNSLRKYLPARLPLHETVWAMTVHKSQGSEFERVLLILSERNVPLITRELIHKGITRARKDVDIWASEDLLKNAISRRISRQSGLTDTLQNQPEAILPNSKPIQ